MNKKNGNEEEAQQSNKIESYYFDQLINNPK